MTHIKSRENVRYDLLTSPLFLSGLVLLLLNDFYLKATLHNYATGKLSDFAGLFIFPFFISVIIGKPKIVYFSTALFFIFWKLEISQPTIDFLSTLTELNIHRTIDSTDLFAMLVLPFSYFYFLKKERQFQTNNALLSSIIGGVSFFAFCATTVPPDREVDHNIEMNKTYNLSISKDSLLKCLKRIGNDGSPNYPTDSMYELYFLIPQYNATIVALAEIKDTTKNVCIIKLQRIIKSELTWKESGREDSIQIEKLTQSDFDRYFQTHFIDNMHPSDNLSDYKILR